MLVSPFDGDYDAIAPVHGVDATAVRTRDLRLGRPKRWVAWDEGRAIATVTASPRPDQRLFMSFEGVDDAIGPLALAAAQELDRPIHALVASSDTIRLDQLTNVGFVIESTIESFDVPFLAARRALRRAWLPAGHRVISAAVADRTRLFELDNLVRNDVPGCDGWLGRREWFDAELDDAPPFDPDAYLVMEHMASCAYVGLVRIWRNPTGPRLGLVGTRRTHRRAPFAAHLLDLALRAASGWGFDTFATEASTANRVTHPALRRLGAMSTGMSHQLVFRQG